LILTKEDYQHYEQFRRPLFKRLRRDLTNRTFVFVGYSIMDTNFRDILEECRKVLEVKSLPLSYAIRPGFRQGEAEFWMDKYNVHLVDAKAEDLLGQLRDTWFTEGHVVVPLEKREAHETFEADTSTRFPRITDCFFQVLPEACTGLAQPRKFFLGAEPTWADIRDNIAPHRILWWTVFETMFSALIRSGIEGGWAKVRPELEYVAGEPCHVIENRTREGGNLDRFWIAHNKGMLIMKYEATQNGMAFRRGEVLRIDRTVTDKGEFWYPSEAYRQLYLPNEAVKNVLRVYEFVPHLKIPPDTFDVNFPDGTRIDDQAAGTYYVKGRSPKMRLPVEGDSKSLGTMESRPIKSESQDELQVEDNIQIPPADSKETTNAQPEDERALSADKLKKLGLALAMYADDHDKQLSDTLEPLKPYIANEQDYLWLLDNVKYVLKEKKVLYKPAAYPRRLRQNTERAAVRHKCIIP